MVPTVNMNQKEFDKLFKAKQQEHQLKMLECNESRAQSFSIGVSAGGVTEITMRGERGNFLWNVYPPAQVVELINQLAASIGCHIHVKPREDFASWREWKKAPDKLEFSEQEEVNLGYLQAEEIKEKEHVATKKAVNKRSTKRRRASSK